MPQNIPPSSAALAKNTPLRSAKFTPNHDPNMIRCRKCHKWYDRTKARTAKASMGTYDKEIDWTFSESVTRVFCPHCGYWHR